MRSKDEEADEIIRRLKYMPISDDELFHALCKQIAEDFDKDILEELRKLR